MKNPKDRFSNDTALMIFVFPFIYTSTVFVEFTTMVYMKWVLPSTSQVAFIFGPMLHQLILASISYIMDFGFRPGPTQMSCTASWLES